jgi:putative nucleotidyltransferase with HDIG domain
MPTETDVKRALALASTASVAERTEAVLELLSHAAGRGYIGEPVSQLEHALQCAAHARKAGADDALVLAALLHDLGHLADADAPTMDGFGVAEHERLGAELLLRLGFSAAVATPVHEHVRAKRYLCATNRTYAERLSSASRETLERQGGPMSSSEAEQFAKAPDLKRVLALRAWDELAKDPDAQVFGLADYRERVRAHLGRDGR